jgi:hypothetical protein
LILIWFIPAFSGIFRNTLAHARYTLAVKRVKYTKKAH